MRHTFIMYLAFSLIVCNLTCLIIDGAWLGAEDLTLMQNLTGFGSIKAAGMFGVFTMFVGFLTHGLPRLIMWDYSFLSGGLQIIRWILFTFSIGAMWAIAQEFRGTITSIFGRR